MLNALVYLDPDDVIDGRPVVDHVLHVLRQREIRCATVIRPVRGFGARRHSLDEPPPIGSSEAHPVLITILDTQEKVRDALTYIRTIVGDGLILTHSVDAW